MKWNDFKKNVEGWAKDRGIYDHSTATAQLLKAVAELGELADAIIKSNPEELVDAIGDVTVCFVNYAAMKEVPFSLPEVYGQHNQHQSLNVMLAHLILAMGDELMVTEGLSKRNNVTYNFVFNATLKLKAIAEVNGLDFMQCCESAWNEIKDRKGKMVEGGAFVKE